MKATSQEQMQYDLQKLVDVATNFKSQNPKTHLFYGRIWYSKNEEEYEHEIFWLAGRTTFQNNVNYSKWK